MAFSLINYTAILKIQFEKDTLELSKQLLCVAAFNNRQFQKEKRYGFDNRFERTSVTVML